MTPHKLRPGDEVVFISLYHGLFKPGAIGVVTKA